MEDDEAATTATFQLAMNELKLLCKDPPNPKGGVIRGHGQQWRLLCSANGKASSSQVGVGGCGRGNCGGGGDDDCSDDDGDGGGLGGGSGGRGGCGGSGGLGGGDDGHGATSIIRRRVRGSAKVGCAWRPSHARLGSQDARRAGAPCTDETRRHQLGGMLRLSACAITSGYMSSSATSSRPRSAPSGRAAGRAAAARPHARVRARGRARNLGADLNGIIMDIENEGVIPLSRAGSRPERGFRSSLCSRGSCTVRLLTTGQGPHSPRPATWARPPSRAGRPWGPCTR
ncbi:hypothetical protein T492DRAFT_357646 [Pavlovales sp. CCMP2436]|nr:hypothetical protein T492DRAFT_357646 [Pavlovales sp. CCMP2436]